MPDSSLTAAGLTVAPPPVDAHFDLATARADTPGTAHLAHFNNAGASLPPRQVNEALIAHLRREESLGGYEAALAADEQVAQIYRSAAAMIGARPSEIALVGSASRGWDTAFYGLRTQPGDRILVDRARYPGHAVAMIQLAHRTGAVIEQIDNDETGQLDVADLERRLLAAGHGPVALVALTHVPTDSGLVNPVAAAGAMCRAAGVPMLLDACQSVGQLVVDVDALGCDMLTATGRKFVRGPRGTGFMYVRSEWLEAIEPMTLDVHAASWSSPEGYELLPDARRFESFERSFAANLGLGAALDYALAIGLPVIEARISGLAESLRQKLSGLPRVRLDRFGVDQCGIVTFSVDGVPTDDVYRELAARRIHTSMTKPQPGAAAAGLTTMQPKIRASVHYYNSDAEIDSLVSVIEHLSVSS